MISHNLSTMSGSNSIFYAAAMDSLRLEKLTMNSYANVSTSEITMKPSQPRNFGDTGGDQSKFS